MQGTIFRLCELKHDWRNLKDVTVYDNVEQGLLKNLWMIFFNQEKGVQLSVVFVEEKKFHFNELTSAK